MTILQQRKLNEKKRDYTLRSLRTSHRPAAPPPRQPLWPLQLDSIQTEETKRPCPMNRLWPGGVAVIRLSGPAPSTLTALLTHPACVEATNKQLILVWLRPIPWQP